MIRKSALSVAFALVLSLGVQSSADAASGRLVIPKTDTNAKIVKVPVKDGQLKVGKRLQGTVYTWKKGDPPCDPMGTTVYAGHAWRGGDGVADRWGRLRKGDIIRVAGCRFKVTKRRYWSKDRKIDHLFRVDGPPRIVLIACKDDDYSKRTMVFAKMI